MAFEIRPMQTTDIDQVYAIEKLSHRAPWTREILRDCLLVGYDCRVLEVLDSPLHGKKVVGYLICRKSANNYHLLNLCVELKEQRKGYGQELLKDLLNSLTDLTYEIVLEVRPSNIAALKLYEKFGFKSDSIKKGYYQDQEGEEDAIVLKKVVRTDERTK